MLWEVCAAGVTVRKYYSNLTEQRRSSLLGSPHSQVVCKCGLPQKNIIPCDEKRTVLLHRYHKNDTWAHFCLTQTEGWHAYRITSQHSSRAQSSETESQKKKKKATGQTELKKAKQPSIIQNISRLDSNRKCVCVCVGGVFAGQQTGETLIKAVC